MRIASLLLALVLAAGSVVGCAADSTQESTDSEESDLVSFTDATILRHLKAAVQGIETTGSEGDPDPYKVSSLKPRVGEAFDDAFLVKRMLPRLKGVARTDDPIPGIEPGGSMADFWSSATKAPDAADYDGDPEGLAAAQALAARWAAARPVIESHLGNLRAVHLGYRGSPAGSLETGAVALALAGQTPTGRVVLIWGIVIWT